jgi:fused signal recognition particle receptor
LADGMVNILIGGKEIDDELLEEVEKHRVKKERV